MEKKLEVRNLQISFRTQNGNVKAVRNISFELNKGETLAIVGESGSGKSVTSKAIIGILSSNAIVEGGEIIYDGQDLLKISEDDFHKIRGDKIAMIFQDPLSSLNPIIRIGDQLTEAMILKGRGNQKNSRKLFNNLLNLLNKNLDEVFPENKEKNKEQCKTFDSFCIESTKLEQAYNTAYAQLVEAQLITDNTIFLLEKKQKVDIAKSLKSIKKYLERSFHPYVLNNNEETAEYLNNIDAIIATKDSEVNVDNVIDILKKLNVYLDLVSKKQKPNYFTLGYYMLKHPEENNIYNLPIDELDKMTRQYIDDNFMIKFIEEGSKAVYNAYIKSIESKKIVLQEAEKALEFFKQDNLSESKKEAFELCKKLSQLVIDAINKLSVTKNSNEYSFKSSIYHFVNTYYEGLKTNPKNEAKYEKDLKKFNDLVEKGKNVTWKVIPPVLVDLSLAQKNICIVIENIIESINNDIKGVEKFDANVEMVNIIDYLKEQASRVVYKVTRSIAKAKALKLLEEVGIPEPTIRFKQYPFEFSGGMRQRIVIAIALSANPDILICDEPTTALDVTIQSQILELINRIKEERNLSVIFITHDLGVVANMADRIAVMYAGKIVEYGTSEDIFYDPKHPYTWALLSSMPDLDTKEKLESIPGTAPNMIYPPKGDAFAERNKYAMKIDFEEEPPLFEVSPTHFAATWLLHPDAPKVDPPKIIMDRIKRMKEKEAQNNGQ